MTNTTAAHPSTLARTAIRSLLDGSSPNGIKPEECGEWADTVQALYDAHTAGGTQAVRDSIKALTNANPRLTRLVSSEARAEKDTWTVAELYDTDFPAPRWAVPGLIPVGLTFLAGRPKLGKSWLALQIASGVGSGGRVFDTPVRKGKVLYLALEDSPRRLKERQMKQGTPRHADITFKTDWEHLSKGGLADLQAQIEKGGYTLIIIDTLSRALGRADQLDLGEMTAILGNLQQMAQLLDVAVMLVDHHRKSNGTGSDPIDDVMGSTGKAAVADAVLGLYRDGTKRTVTLRAVGRDIGENELALQWDGFTCTWVLLGEAGAVRKSSLQSAIEGAIRDLTRMGELPTTSTIATHLAKQPSQVSKELSDMLSRGLVVKGEKLGKMQPYSLPLAALPTQVEK